MLINAQLFTVEITRRLLKKCSCTTPSSFPAEVFLFSFGETKPKQ